MGKKGLGAFMVAHRKYLRLTQEQLAERMGVSKSAVAKWETDGGLPDRDNLRKLADAMNVSVDELHGVIENTGVPEKEVNITPDVIAALEMNGYIVIRPGEQIK